MERDPIIEAVLAREGKPSNRLDDRGGNTHFGITKPFLSDRLGRLATDADIDALTIELAREHYASFMRDTRIGQIVNQQVRGAVFDAAVHSGASRAIKLLQGALGLKPDGVIGPITLAALPHLDGSRLAVRVHTQRLRFIAAIVRGDLEDRDRDGVPDQVENLGGWIDRVCDQIEEVA